MSRNVVAEPHLAQVAWAVNDLPAAVRFYVDNWRWTGVPFFLRSGKRLKRRVSEVAVQFREPPVLMFKHETREQIAKTRVEERAAATGDAHAYLGHAVTDGWTGRRSRRAPRW